MRPAALAAGALVALSAAGCGKAELDVERAEAALKSRITRQTGVEIDTVRCPQDVEAQRGDTFRCVAVASNGQRARVEVTQRDDAGNVSWRLVGGNYPDSGP